MQKSNYRFYIEIHQSQGADAKTIFNELKNFATSHALSHTTVKLWFRKLKSGHESLEDKHRTGSPVTKTLPVNINRVRVISLKKIHYLHIMKLKLRHH